MLSNWTKWVQFSQCNAKRRSYHWLVARRRGRQTKVSFVRDYRQHLSGTRNDINAIWIWRINEKYQLRKTISIFLWERAVNVRRKAARGIYGPCSIVNQLWYFINIGQGAVTRSRLRVRVTTVCHGHNCCDPRVHTQLCLQWRDINAWINSDILSS